MGRPRPQGRARRAPPRAAERSQQPRNRLSPPLPRAPPLCESLGELIPSAPPPPAPRRRQGRGPLRPAGFPRGDVQAVSHGHDGCFQDCRQREVRRQLLVRSARPLPAPPALPRRARRRSGAIPFPLCLSHRAAAAAAASRRASARPAPGPATPTPRSTASATTASSAPQALPPSPDTGGLSGALAVVAPLSKPPPPSVALPRAAATRASGP